MEDDFDLSALKGKKKRKNVRQKGNTFENKIAKLFNEVFETTEFMRSPGSGAFATTHKLPEHLKISGDLITPKNFKFIIECKKGYNKEGISSLLNNNSKIYDFIGQADRDAKREIKNFLICWMQDRQKIMVFLRKDLFEYLVGPGLYMMDHIITIKKFGPNKEYEEFILVDLKKLLEKSRSCKTLTSWFALNS